MPTPTPRPTYSKDALSHYFAHINLPTTQQTTILDKLTSKEWPSSLSALASLTTLQKYQQAKIPFANLYLHYSKHHIGTFDPWLLYEYIVESGGLALEGSLSSSGITSSSAQAERQAYYSRDRVLNDREAKWIGRGPSGGRGGSCSLNNSFFGTVMRSLGMRVKSTGARVSKAINGGPKGKFDGWNHVVNLVWFEGVWYLVDVGFGINGPTRPMELVDGKEVEWGVTGDRVKLVWQPIGEFEDEEQKCWVLQHRREGAEHEWMDVYCFGENEFLPQDFEVMHFKMTRDVIGGFFNHMLMCVRNVMEGEDVVGVITMINAKVKRIMRGKSETLQICGSEVERWEALEKWFGIVLGEQERLGIRGLRTELIQKPKEA